MKEEKRSITCIVCPLGCQMKLKVKDGKIEDIKGNKCRQGIKYARQEFYNPQRVVTTTVKVKDGKIPLLPVRTNKPIPKEIIRECVRYLAKVEVKAPVKLGEIIVHNILNSGADVISTRKICSNDVYRKA